MWKPSKLDGNDGQFVFKIYLKKCPLEKFSKDNWIDNFAAVLKNSEKFFISKELGCRYRQTHSGPPAYFNLDQGYLSLLSP